MDRTSESQPDKLLVSTQDSYALNASIESSSDSSIDIDTRKLSFWRLLAYGIGGIPMQLLQNVAAVFLTPFLLETPKLSSYYVSIILLLGRLSDAMTDPIVGYSVFRTHTPMGQKRPW